MNGPLFFFLCFSLATLVFPIPADANFLVFNTSLTVTDYPSMMFSEKYTQFPEWHFEGRVAPLTLLPNCVLEEVKGHLAEIPLVGVVKMDDANDAGCNHIYMICKAMQERDSRFVGLLVNIGIGLETVRPIYSNKLCPFFP